MIAITSRSIGESHGVRKGATKSKDNRAIFSNDDKTRAYADPRFWNGARSVVFLRAAFRLQRLPLFTLSLLVLFPPERFLSAVPRLVSPSSPFLPGKSDRASLDVPRNSGPVFFADRFAAETRIFPADACTRRVREAKSAEDTRKPAHYERDGDSISGISISETRATAKGS